jgi:hypothetical protein
MKVVRSASRTIHIFPPGNVPGIHFHYGLSRPQGHGTVGRKMSLRNQVTPPGIDPETVRLVAQRLNHYATPGPSENVILVGFPRRERASLLRYKYAASILVFT